MMSRILLIDSNPDNRKSLEGLLRYRTRHDFEVVDNHTDGARRAVSLAPDLIMMNVLLFMGNNYAFPRVLQQHAKTQNISFLVLANGHLDEVTEKQIQASGMANIVYLPVSAEELEAAVHDALAQSGRIGSDEVASVVWPQAVKDPSTSSKTGTQRAEASGTPKIKPVQWPTASKPAQQTRPASSPKSARRKPTPQALPKRTSKQSSGFRPATFDQVQDDSNVTGQPKFKTQQWQTIDPKDLKKRK